jgi:hypothetical protein
MTAPKMDEGIEPFYYKQLQHLMKFIYSDAEGVSYGL